MLFTSAPGITLKPQKLYINKYKKILTGREKTNWSETTVPEG